MADAPLVYLPQYFVGARSWTLLDTAGDPVDLTNQTVVLRVRPHATSSDPHAPAFSRTLTTDQGSPGKVTYAFEAADWSQREDDPDPQVLSPEVGKVYDVWFITYNLMMNVALSYPEDRPGVLTVTPRAGLY